MNPDFERWVVNETFSGLDTPISDGTKRLMQRAWEAGVAFQAQKDAQVIEALNELEAGH
jgi:hypothetical protein